MTTKARFDEAAQRLLGEEKYSNLLKSGYSRPDFCREIAQDEFVDNLYSPPPKKMTWPAFSVSLTASVKGMASLAWKISKRLPLNTRACGFWL